MNRLQAPNGLDFHNDYPFDDKIQPMMTNQFFSISNRNRLLAFDPQPSMSELQMQRTFVDGLEKAWPQFAMHLNCGTDHSTNDLLRFIGNRFSAFLLNLLYLFFVFFVLLVVHTFDL